MKMKLMMLNTFKKGLVIFVMAIFSFQLLGFVPQAQAKWQDQSDQLPGMNEEPSPLVYAAVATLTIGIVYWIVKAYQNKKVAVEKGGDDQSDEKKPEAGTQDSSSMLKDFSRNNAEISNLDKNTVNNNKHSIVQPYIGIQKDTAAGLSQYESKNKMAVIGLTVNY